MKIKMTKKNSVQMYNQQLFDLCNRVENSSEILVEKLLKKGADPNTEGAIEQAAYRHKFRIVNALLETGRIRKENIQEAMERCIEGLPYHPNIGFYTEKILLQHGARPTRNMFNLLYEKAAAAQNDPDLRRDDAVQEELELYLECINLLNTYVPREQIYCTIV